MSWVSVSSFGLLLTMLSEHIEFVASFRHAFGSLDGEEGELASSLKLIM